jgi:hypothetical protein
MLRAKGYEMEVTGHKWVDGITKRYTYYDV